MVNIMSSPASHLSNGWILIAKISKKKNMGITSLCQKCWAAATYNTSTLIVDPK